MFIAALFTRARIWTQPGCPSTDEWIKKTCCVYRKEYYSVVSRDTFESVLMRCMNHEPITQSDMTKKKKDKYCILIHIYGILKNDTEALIYRPTIEK